MRTRNTSSKVKGGSPAKSTSTSNMRDKFDRIAKSVHEAPSPIRATAKRIADGIIASGSKSEAQVKARNVLEAPAGKGSPAPAPALPAPALPAPRGGKVSNLDLGYELAKRNAPQSEIDAAFIEVFRSRGKDLSDPEVLRWIAGRRDRYMTIGRQKVDRELKHAATSKS